MRGWISSVFSISKGKEHKKYEFGNKVSIIRSVTGIILGAKSFRNEHRLGRNFYKGLIGDAINILLAAAAYNFKRAMKALWLLIKIISEKPLANGISLKEDF